MRKIIQLDEHFPTGETTMQPVLLWGPGQSRHDVGRITKHASEALDYIKSVSPEPGKTHMLVLALGSEEAYGPNRNGDGFPERPVPAKTKHAAHDGRKWWVAPGEELTKHYQSFETNPAHAFLHHQNKDPKKASGYVKKAFWNPKMHRVELLIVVDNQKDPEWVQRVNDGDFPAVSMGCRIKYDVCSRCGNVAPTRAQYCDHVRNEMNQVNADGTKNYVHNPSPNFFDISRVFRPADRTGYTLKKVAYAYELRSSAEMGEAADAVADKAAAIRKVSDIEKIIKGTPVASSSLSSDEQKLIRQFKDYAGTRLASTPEIPLSAFAGHPLAEALATLASMNVSMTGPEFVRLVVSHLTGTPLPEHLVHKTAAMLPTVLAIYERSPALLDAVYDTGILDLHQEKVSASLRERLKPWAEKKANMGSLLYRRLVPEGIGIRPDEAPMTDVLHYQDPTTGRTVQTTRGAAVDASESMARSDVKKMLGGGALLLGGYKLMGAFPSLRPWRLPATALAGYAMMRGGTPSRFHTQEGFDVPGITEFGPREKMSMDNLSRAVVTLLEDGEKIASSTVNQDLVDALERVAHVDAARGITLDLDDVAMALGGVIVA